MVHGYPPASGSAARYGRAVAAHCAVSPPRADGPAGGRAGVRFGAGPGFGLALGFQHAVGGTLGLRRGDHDELAVIAQCGEPAGDVGGRVVAQARLGRDTGRRAEHGAADLGDEFLAGVPAGAVVVEGGDAGPVQPGRRAGGVSGLVERGAVVGLAAGELPRCGQRDLVAGGVVAGACAGGVHQGGPAGGEVTVEHVLRLAGQVRAGGLGGAVPVGQVVGLLGVEHAERAQQRHRADGTAVRVRGRVAGVGVGFELLPEHDMDRRLAAADLAAQLG